MAEFAAKRWVWIPDEDCGYLPGHIVDESEEGVYTVQLENGEKRRVPLESCEKMNPPKYDRVDDMADLTYLNEPSIINNLKLRYLSDMIYVIILR